MTYWVYLLKTKRRIYIGCTSNLNQRIERHKKGYVPATKEEGPIQLISYIAFKDKYRAYNFEKYLKSGSGRAFLKKKIFIIYLYYIFQYSTL